MVSYNVKEATQHPIHSAFKQQKSFKSIPSYLEWEGYGRFNLLYEIFELAVDVTGERRRGLKLNIIDKKMAL